MKRLSHQAIEREAKQFLPLHLKLGVAMYNRINKKQENRRETK